MKARIIDIKDSGGDSLVNKLAWAKEDIGKIVNLKRIHDPNFKYVTSCDNSRRWSLNDEDIDCELFRTPIYQALLECELEEK